MMENRIICFELETITVNAPRPYIRWDYNEKRSGDIGVAFINGTMSGIVIVTQASKKEYLDEIY